METIFLNTKNKKTNEPHKSILSSPQRSDLRSLDKLVALQNLSMYYTWKDIRNIMRTIIAPTRNGKFELPDGFLFCFRYSSLYRVHL